MLKLLQLQPEKEIIVEFIKNEDYKYVRVLGEFQLSSSCSLNQCGNHLMSALSRLELARYLALPQVYERRCRAVAVRFRCILSEASWQATGSVPIPGAIVQ